MERIVDFALIAIIIICAWTGYKKGLIMGVGGILAIIVSIYLANLVSVTFSYEVIPALRPFASGYMESNYRMAVYNELGIELPEEDTGSGIDIMGLLTSGGDEDPETASTPTPTPTQAIKPIVQDERLSYSLEDLINSNPEIERSVYVESLKSIGVFAKPANIIADEAIEYEEVNGTGRFDSLIHVMCSKLTYVVGFVISFLLIIIIFTVAGNLMNLSFKIPGLDLLNDITGSVFGVLTGLMFCVIAVWILKFAGIIISEDRLQNSAVAMWFMNRDILGGFLGI